MQRKQTALSNLTPCQTGEFASRVPVALTPNIFLYVLNFYGRWLSNDLVITIIGDQNRR